MSAPRPHRTAEQTAALLRAIEALMLVGDSVKSIAYAHKLSQSYAFKLVTDRLGYRAVLISAEERALVEGHRAGKRAKAAEMARPAA